MAWWQPLALTSFLVSGSATAAPASATPAADAPEASFPLEAYRKTIAIRAELNGVPGLFLVDTAGGITVVSPGAAKAAGCVPWGRLTGFRMMGDRVDTPRCDKMPLTIDGHRLDLSVAAVLDIAPLIAKDAAPVDGSIALDAFAGQVVTIDFPAMRLIIESPASLRARVGDRPSLPLLLSRELQGRALAASVGVPSRQGTVWMELDSGNGGTLLVSKPYARLFGLDPEAEGVQTADFPVADGLRAQGNAFAPDMILDGNLGMPFLRDKVVTLDLRQGRLWIQTPGQ